MALSKAEMQKKLAALVQTCDADDIEQSDDPDRELRKWDYWREESETRVVVVEVHKGWCGPSPIMLSVFQRWYLDLNDPDERIAFVGADPEQVQAVRSLKEVSGKTCMPVYIVLRNKNIAGITVVLDAPELKRVIDIAIPPEATEEDEYM